MSDDLHDNALDYHRLPTPGKIAVVATKPLANQRDLALAYTPGVAEACNAIVADPAEASNLTSRANLVGVITNGTAVLGLGNIGPLAAKPVMEGKAVLFKKFAGIDVFDIEIAERDPAKLIDIIASLEPTFGGINLEDIKAPECFEIEARLRERCKIPVFHDDQHGTAIIVAAALVNGLRVIGKELGEVKLVVSGAGAAALACLDLLVDMGMPVANIIVTDKFGVVWRGRKEEMDPRKDRYAKDTDARRLAEVIADADVFLGLSAPDVLTSAMVDRMCERPLILALANPRPEIMPEEVRKVRPNAVIATGRSDYPNQVNNVLCFPYIFRGALDVGATTINEAMKIACVRAIADLAMAPPSDIVAAAYGETPLVFGPEYLIPTPFDPRLILQLAPAVAKAAMASGLAMRPIFHRARAEPKRLVYAEGEDERVLRAAQEVYDEGLAKLILIGRHDVVAKRLKTLALRIRIGHEFELVDPDDDPRFPQYWKLYYQIMERKGVTPDYAKTLVRTRNGDIAALMVKRGEADVLLCGAISQYHRQLHHLVDIIGLAPGVHTAAALTAVVHPKGTFFLCDTHVVDDPSAAQIAEMAVRAAEIVRRFAIEPKLALLSHSSFGSSPAPSARKMREALALIRERAPELEVEGEMTSEAAISESLRERLFPSSRLAGSANLLIMPNLDAANISLDLMKALGDGQPIGPMLLGLNLPAHIVSQSVTVRGLVNMSAVAVLDAQLTVK
jgi:malate dehydrogenase (oxaloacetate-decarboxylating)(NADP+)